jgi:hypothetical protein
VEILFVRTGNARATSPKTPTVAIVAMNPPLLPTHFFGTRQFRQALPGPISWFRALCLMPLAMPGVKVVLSGLTLYSWLQWLGFPIGWLLATILFLFLHVLIPIVVAACFYHIVKLVWPGETPNSWARNFWFACSTIAIILLSFFATVAVSAVFELSVCQIPQVVAVVGARCNNHFMNKDLFDVIASMETYNFRYYNWMVWLVITAFLYRFESRLWKRQRQLSYFPQRPQLTSASQYPDTMEVESAPEIEHRGVLDLDNPTSP